MEQIKRRSDGDNYKERIFQKDIAKIYATAAPSDPGLVEKQQLKEQRKTKNPLKQRTTIEWLSKRFKNKTKWNYLYSPSMVKSL